MDKLGWDWVGLVNGRCERHLHVNPGTYTHTYSVSFSLSDTTYTIIQSHSHLTHIYTFIHKNTQHHTHAAYTHAHNYM